MSYGSHRAFVIRLEDGTETVTEVRAGYRQLHSHRRTTSRDGAAVVPFTLGDNDKLYVKGSINGGAPLDLQVDLGAGGLLIKKSSVPKVAMTFDTTITLRNSDGENVVPSSSRNTLDVAGLRWDDVPFAVADNMTWREDGIVGNGLFQDRILEVDYDRMVLIVHETLPDIGGWQRADMFLDGVVPFVRGTLRARGLEQAGWFLVDTGAYTSIFKHQRLTSISKFSDEFRRLFGPLGGTVQGPVVSFGGQTFPNINYAVSRYEGNPADLGVLGNDVLKRVNLVVDNRLGALYFRPNARAADRFRNPERMVIRLLALAAIAGVVVLTYRRMR
jgi:hypothetical protein